jgi:hypothetical protein
MIGEILGARYRVIGKVGEGAMGQVYLAEHLHLGRREAIKVLLPGVAMDPAFVARFRREARATNRVQHPNIVSVYDFGQLPDGRLFLSMEYADGESLHQLIEDHGAMPVARVLHIVSQLAHALDHAHERGVIHRDLKPANLILTEHRGHKDVLKVLDFGMAKIVSPEYIEQVAVTGKGDIFGTASYMAPEQFYQAEADPRSDIYAIGCIAFELLVGEPPFVGHPMELMDAHRSKSADAPSRRRPNASIDAMLDQIVLTCLEKDPAERFQTGGVLYSALKQVKGFGSWASAGRRVTARFGSVQPKSDDFAPEMEETTDTEARDQYDAVIAVADTGIMSPEALRAGAEDATLELAEALIDMGANDHQLTILVAKLRALEIDIARNRGARASLDLRDVEVEQAAREREGSLRFAIGELKFDRDNLGADAEEDLEHQIQQLEAKLADQVGVAQAQLDEITEQGITLVAARATLDDEQIAAFLALRARVDTALPRFDENLALAPLIDRYSSMRDALATSSDRK